MVRGFVQTLKHCLCYLSGHDYVMWHIQIYALTNEDLKTINAQEEKQVYLCRRCGQEEDVV